ncbi:MAG: deoxyribose-phosphate aldolase [Flavobacteriaceae bacterium]|nr:deoxyribose-phosphate aldolase [Flavobacteriaceae bacterium]|tara:strand:+ start:241089 stop:241829 length:741 start_codon:yes stop_codon:yes gene_type:complete
MNKHHVILLIALFQLVFISCTEEKNSLTAQEIIDKAIASSGGEIIANSTISFQFRDKHYTAKREGGNFRLTRSFDSIQDILTNDSFKRLINGKGIDLTDSIANNYRNSVNSVHYFSVLPFGLNDPAVKKKLLRTKKIKNSEYYKLEIRFAEEGGGEDFNDVFIYWIDKETFYVDYLAYQYFTDGGGYRFRELKEQCIINGIRFVDYTNFKPSKTIDNIHEIDDYYINGNLEKVSEIILRNIEVNPN